ncbi:MAG: D-alanyl-D-alanine carboxypeptidase family protein [Pseudomonadota bacterium]
MLRAERLSGRLTVMMLAGLSLLHASAGRAADAELAMTLSTGQVHVARNLDRRVRPASLTKLMTVYVVFDAVRSGKLKGDQMVKVSSQAASQAPVRAGVRAGKSYRLDELLDAAIVRSGNDAAVALAEAVAGTEAAFVKRMNGFAHRIGLVNTRFANASGLPHANSYTSARDIARLVLALRRDFPNERDRFAQSSFSLSGVRIGGHNRWLNAYDGADGLKTGFTCRAGYHLAATALRDGRSVLAVVLGARTLSERLERARQLADAAYAVKPSAGEPLGPAVATATPTALPIIAAGCKEPRYAASGYGPVNWSVALPIYPSKAEAVRRSRTFIRRFAPGARIYLTPRRTNRVAYYAGATGLTRKQASRACLKARKKGWFCLLHPPKVAKTLWTRAQRALRKRR